MTAPARECQPEGEGYTEAQGYAASLRQMAQWMVDGNSHDVDEGELCMAANLIDRQAHRIEELTKALEWQPIDTAPPAGTVIDVWMVLPSGHGARWTGVMWGEVGQRWISGPLSQDAQGWKATHWMRLPRSPVVPLERSGGAT